MVLRQDKYVDTDKFRKTRNAQRERYYSKTNGYARHPWTIEEMDLIMTSSFTDTELSDRVKHSVNAIQVMRCKIKKMEAKDEKAK